MTQPKLRRECWAALLGGCSKEKSKEHVLSKCVNNAMGALLSVNLPYPPHRISSESMQIRYLCEYHNGALSDLDTEAGRFVTTLRDFHAAGPRRISDGAPEDQTVQFDGQLLERWGLKTFLNYSLWISRMPADIQQVSLTGHRILQYVFGAGPRPENCGLYIYGRTITPVEDLPGRMFSMVVHETQLRVFQPKINELTPPYRMPVFMRLTTYGGDIGIAANLCASIEDGDWNRLISNIAEHPQKVGTLRPPNWSFGVMQPPLKTDSFSRLRIDFTW
jgi:hypothetical protein